MKRLFQLTTLLLPYLGLSQGFVDIFSTAYHYQMGSDAYHDMNVVLTQAKVPVVLSNDNVILSGAQFNSYSIAPSTVGDQPTVEGSSFINTTLFTGYKAYFENDKDFILLGLAKLNGHNYQNLERDHFQFGTIFNYGFKLKNGNRMTLGSYINTDMYSLFWVPLVGGDFKIGERLRIYGNAPITATVDYSLSETIHLGWYFKGTIGSFYSDQGLFPTYVDQSDNLMQLFTDIYLTKNVVLRPAFGFVIGRSYRYYRTDDQMDFRISAIKIGDDRTQLNEDIVQGLSPVIGCSLHFRVKTE